MTIHIGIALYFIKGNMYFGTPSYFHWALVATDASSWESQPVYTIELKRNSSITSEFVQSFTSSYLTRSDAFVGVVHLFSTIDYTIDSFQSMIHSNFPAQDSGWRLPGRFGPQGWTCATWILQILGALRTRGTWTTQQNFEHTYTRVLNLAHAMRSGGQGQYQGAVRVIRFE
ncbi:hypothetical protein BDP27DRAFT_247011 [Rhodocollybia butyracea]|uniref:Uncharacterized protein n=1 Tax=Rhodocollybia butyracea TaxID=206335 RepID=A0A9P5Q3E2_9AGAR|nr:hypothetical protein BDP27DRAFT_247011 [Rhodocollybia butyracea]